MSERRVRVSQLVGRRVRDEAGRPIGRIEELLCEIELHEGGRDYVVRELRVGTFGPLDHLGGSTMVRALLRTLVWGTGYERFDIPWSWMDLSDPARPRVNRAGSELRVSHGDGGDAGR